MFFHVIGELLGHDLANEGAHEGAAELRLGLALELGVGQFDGDHSGKTLANIVAGKVGILLPEDVVLTCIIVDHAGEGGAEALHMHAALGRVDVIREAHDGLGVRGVPLHRDLDLTGLLHRGVGLGGAGKVDGVLETVRHGFAVVQVLDEVDNAAGVAELVHLGGSTRVRL